ncbi:hypothetical protein HMPREF1417_00926 [Helicobacter pylori GAM260Bi]|nr:hypothetical protein HMPREF1417_00926 [Helicobacter pylori GAM260Bi]EMH70472.1 hypothetical protein HMPREF1452_01158 [Helicobacter pylori HP260Bi]
MAIGGVSRCFNEAIGRACGVKKRSSFHIGLIVGFKIILIVGVRTYS